MATAKVTSKGQVTLPKSVRDRLHLVAGDRVDFRVNEKGEVTVQPLRGSIERLFGFLPRPAGPALTVREMDEEISRSLVEDDERIRQGRTR